MQFDDIHPFVRYVHYLPLDKHACYHSTIPYDCRLFFCYDGEGAICVKDNLYEMQPGYVLIIPSGVNYHLRTPENSLTYIAVNFDYTQEHCDKSQPIPPAERSLYDPRKRLEEILFYDNLSFNDVIYLQQAKQLSGKLLSLEQEYSRKFLYYERLCSDILADILIQCARLLSSQKFRGSNETINRVLSYIQENYGQKITNEQIGEAFSLHPNYVNSMVKSFTGLSLHQYVMRVRISHAMELMQTEEYSIGEIATLCGFCDIYHFSKYFRKAVGVSPSKYLEGVPFSLPGTAVEFTE